MTEKREKFIRLTLSDSEKAAIEYAARSSGVPAAAWCRSMAIRAAKGLEDRTNMDSVREIQEKWQAAMSGNADDIPKTAPTIPIDWMDKK